MNNLTQYITEKLHLNRDIKINDIDIEYIHYSNGVKNTDFRDKIILNDYKEFINNLSEDEKYNDKLKNIKKVIIKYWYESDGGVSAVVKYEVTFINNQNTSFSNNATWEAPRGRYTLSEGPKEIGNKPDEYELMKYIILHDIR
jgi:hypothetical protein